MNIKRIAILGGTGFIGTSLCNRLSSEGYHLRVLTRDRESNRKDLIVLPNLELVQIDIHSPERLHAWLAACDAVINLVGILNERNKGDFERIHFGLTENLLHVCVEHDIRRYLQLSSLHASPSGTSRYLQTKGLADQLLHDNSHGIKVTSFHPSVIFGRDDKFLNQFASLLKWLPILPLACHRSCLAPLYILDLVEMMTRSLTDPLSFGRRFNLCGAQNFTLAELVRYTRSQTRAHCLLLPLNNFLSRMEAYYFDGIGGVLNLLGIDKPFSMDNYLSLQQDSVCEPNDFSFYNISPASIESVMPRYLAGK